MNFRHGIHHVLEHDVIGVGACAARCLNDDRRIQRGRCVHDGERLFHIVDVERRHAIVVFRRVIEQLTQRDASHGTSFSGLWTVPLAPRSMNGSESMRHEPAFLQDILKTSTPGKGFPSIHSRNAPPAVETYEKSCDTPAWFNAATVSPPPATDTSLPALVRVAACFAA